MLLNPLLPRPCHLLSEGILEVQDYIFFWPLKMPSTAHNPSGEVSLVPVILFDAISSATFSSLYFCRHSNSIFLSHQISTSNNTFLS